MPASGADAPPPMTTASLFSNRCATWLLLGLKR
jgi:hypothetical protein